MGLNKKSVDDINAKGKRVLVRCDFNVPLKDGVITDETRIVAALPTIQKLLNDGGKVILCSHLGKVKEGPNEKESLAPVAKRLSEKLGKEVVFVADYNVTGEAATAAVAAMQEGDVVLLQNTRFRGKEETKNGEEFSKELADLADLYACYIRRIRLLKRRHSGTAFNVSSVYEKVLIISICSYIIRSANKSTNSNTIRGKLGFDKLRCKFSAKHRINGIF